jgi:hypothetical protein
MSGRDDGTAPPAEDEWKRHREANDCCLLCECDSCLNGSAPIRIAGAGVVHPWQQDDVTDGGDTNRDNLDSAPPPRVSEGEKTRERPARSALLPIPPAEPKPGVRSATAPLWLGVPEFDNVEQAAQLLVRYRNEGGLSAEGWRMFEGMCKKPHHVAALAARIERGRR